MAKETLPVAEADKKTDDSIASLNTKDTTEAEKPEGANEVKDEGAQSSSKTEGTSSVNGKLNESNTADASAPLTPGTVVLGKLKGFPPWPAMVCGNSPIAKTTNVSDCH